MAHGEAVHGRHPLPAPRDARRAARQKIARVAAEGIGDLFERAKIAHAVQRGERPQDARGVCRRPAQPAADGQTLFDRDIRAARAERGAERPRSAPRVVLFGRELVGHPLHEKAHPAVLPPARADEIVQPDRADERIDEVITALAPEDVQREVDLAVRPDPRFHTRTLYHIFLRNAIIPSLRRKISPARRTLTALRASFCGR